MFIFQEKKEDLKLAMGIAAKAKDKPAVGAKPGGGASRVNKVRSIIEQLEKSKRELNTHCEAVTTALTDLNENTAAPSTPAKTPRPLASRFATSTPKGSASVEPSTSTPRTAKSVPKKKVIEHVKKGFAEVLPDPDTREFQAEIVDLTTTDESPVRKPKLKKVAAEAKATPASQPKEDPVPQPESSLQVEVAPTGEVEHAASPDNASQASSVKDKMPSAEESQAKPSRIPSLKSRTPSVEKSTKAETPKSSRSASVDNTAVKKSKSPSVEPIEVAQKSRSPSVAKTQEVDEETVVPVKEKTPQKSQSPALPVPVVPAGKVKDSRSSSISDTDRESRATSKDVESIRHDSISEMEKSTTKTIISRQASISTEMSQTLNTTDITVNLRQEPKNEPTQNESEETATGAGLAAIGGGAKESEKSAKVVPSELDATAFKEKKSGAVNLQQLRKMSAGRSFEAPKTGKSDFS